MKLTKIVMCAMAVGAMALVCDKAQAGGVVIENDLYVPINIKGTVSYVDGGKIKTASFTSKQILFGYWNFDKGTQLAVGPDNDIYAISKTEVLEDLTLEGNFYFYTDEYISTETDKANGSSTYSEAGTVALNFWSDGDYIDTADNQYAFLLTGTYTESEKESADNSQGYYSRSVKFGSSNLGGWGYNFDVSADSLPVSGSVSGSASGKLLDY
jgi:hypothetical protein